MMDDTKGNMSEEQQPEEKKAREPKKNSIPRDEVKALTDGIPQYEKASFLVVGHKNGVRIALPRTSGVSRAYFYGDYKLIPDDEAIRVYSPEQRKDLRKGGITAEIDFALGLEAARRALGKLVDAVKAAPAPAAKLKKPPKAPKAAAEATPASTDDAGDSTATE